MVRLAGSILMRGSHALDGSRKGKQRGAFSSLTRSYSRRKTSLGIVGDLETFEELGPCKHVRTRLRNGPVKLISWVFPLLLPPVDGLVGIKKPVACQHRFPMCLRFVGRVCVDWPGLMFLAGFLVWLSCVCPGYVCAKELLGFISQASYDSANVLFAHTEFLRDLALRPSPPPVQVDDSFLETRLEGAGASAAGKDSEQQSTDFFVIPSPL